MNSSLKKLLALGVAITCIGLTGARAGQVTWGNAGNTFPGLGLANGILVPTGDLVLVGAFPGLTAAQIKTQSSNPSLLFQTGFVQFAQATISSGNPFQDGSTQPGYWQSTPTNNTNSTLTLNIAGQQIYYWDFNSPTLAGATQQGIFTAPGNSRWVFPNDVAIPNNTVTDLSDVPNSTSGIIVGGFGVGNANGVPEYNLALIPEPTTYAMCIIGAMGLFAFLRRRVAA